MPILFKFPALFFGVLALLWFASQMSISREMLIYPWTQWLAGALHQVLHSIDPSVFINGPVLGVAGGGFTAIVTPECNGLIPFSFLIAAVTASRAKPISKLNILLIGFLLVQAFNFGRMLVLFQIGTHFPDSFAFVHEFFSHVLTAAFVFLIWFVWMRSQLVCGYRPSHAHTRPSVHRHKGA